MSATAARQILSVDKVAGTVEAKAPDGTGPTSIVPLANLKRPELLRAAKVAFPAVGGKAWQKVGNAAIISAITSNDPAVATAAPVPALPLDPQGERPNRFPAKCKVCGFTLAEGVGRIRKEGAKWQSYCVNHLPASSEPTVEWTAPEATPAPVAPPVPEPVSTANGGVEGALEVLIRQVVRSEVQAQAAPTVDEAQVRSIVQSIVDEAPARVIEVHTREAVNTLPKLHHSLLPEVVQVLGCGIKNVFLVGPAGSGKSTLAAQAFDALGLGTESISFGPTTPTSKLFGYNDANGHYVDTPFRRAYEGPLGFIGDELDNGHPGLVAELNQALANGTAAFADGTIQRHKDNVFVATGNTFGRGPDRLFVGRNILDAATLDRFVIIEVPVDERLERNAALQYASTEADGKLVERWVSKVQKARKAITDAALPLVCSPRSSIEGAKLLVGGIPEANVVEWTLAAGWSAEHRAKVGV